LNYETVSKAEFITIAADTKLHAYGIGNITITSREGTITLIKIWQVPNVGASLISIIPIVDTGYTVEFDKSRYFVSKMGTRTVLE